MGSNGYRLAEFKFKMQVSYECLRLIKYIHKLNGEMSKFESEMLNEFLIPVTSEVA
jgi:hypothetical protein